MLDALLVVALVVATLMLSFVIGLFLLLVVGLSEIAAAVLGLVIGVSATVLVKALLGNG